MNRIRRTDSSRAGEIARWSDNPSILFLIDCRSETSRDRPVTASTPCALYLCLRRRMCIRTSDAANDSADGERFPDTRGQRKEDSQARGSPCLGSRSRDRHLGTQYIATA